MSNEKFVKNICIRGSIPDELEGICEQKVTDLESKGQGPGFTRDDIVYYYYSYQYHHGYEFRYATLGHLASVGYNSSKPTFIIVASWRDNRYSSPITTIVESILPNYDTNIIVVDWSVTKPYNYTYAYRSVEVIGFYLAEVIYNMRNIYYLSYEVTQCVGFSLGAHICGCAGNIF